MSKYGHRTDNWKEEVLDKMGGEAVADAFLRGKYKLVKVAKKAVWAILNFVATATVSFTARPGDTVSEFFRVRHGLYVWDAFRSLLDENWLVSLIRTIPATKISYYDLEKSANDFQIEKEFEGNKTPFIFEDLGVFLAVQAGFILAQWNNKNEGPLLANGYANLFYVRIGGRVFAVSVNWYSVGWGWSVRSYPRDGIEWSAGTRVFSSNEHLEA